MVQGDPYPAKLTMRIKSYLTVQTLPSNSSEPQAIVHVGLPLVCCWVAFVLVVVRRQPEMKNLLEHSIPLW